MKAHLVFPGQLISGGQVTRGPLPQGQVTFFKIFGCILSHTNQKFLVNIYQKFGVMQDLTRRFIFSIHCTFVLRRVGSCMARDLSFRYGTCKEFLFGAACGLARVCDSSSHFNFRCARSHAALGSNSSCSMCRQTLRQSVRTMRSAAGRPNLGRCQPR